MSNEVTAAVIAGSLALVAAAVTAYLTVTSAHRQRSVDLVVSALADMGGGTQRRSAGLAALAVMRGNLDRRLGRLDARLWQQYGPGVGQQLFRVLAYVLNEAKIKTHGTENAITMTDWLLRDPMLRFADPDQRRRLATSLQAYDKKLGVSVAPQTAAHAFRTAVPGWLSELGVNPPAAGSRPSPTSGT